MSGGSYDYAYCKIQDMAEELREEGSCSCAPPAMRRAFKAHLQLVAKACRAIEWNDSCDGSDDEIKLLTKILTPSQISEASIEMAQEAVKRIEEDIELIKKMTLNSSRR